MPQQPLTLFLYYDHILTFPMEVKFLWNHLGFNGKSLFLLNRYYSALGSVVVTYSMFSTALTPKVITSRSKFYLVILTLRIWAIYNFNQKILAFLSISLIILIGLAFLYTSSRTWRRLPFKTGVHNINCESVSDLFENISIPNLEAAGAWEALFSYDTLLLILLLYKGFKTRRELGRLPLLEIILRDGALCYIAMTMVIFANIVTFYSTGILMCRLSPAFPEGRTLDYFQRYISHNDISYHLSTPSQRP
ncbi:hypothetical protein K435DRAFT_811104 [Dendrothele bispora CBS 962.96]|uniref:DUF6533 domain-containing protein n=1 Tax=Dendrothele bispora (strain CBS 962.96) TaxID=1314807 RepID=A0A4V4HBD0_DENBC|nr:hypothetical protein K435DRAFT_811104 [Dendrothele bispora CBS 962.96]